MTGEESTQTLRKGVWVALPKFRGRRRGGPPAAHQPGRAGDPREPKNAREGKQTTPLRNAPGRQPAIEEETP